MNTEWKGGDLKSYFSLNMNSHFCIGERNKKYNKLYYPEQKTSNLIHLYYFLNGGYLITSVYSLLISEKLPDFYENFLQHLCAIILVYFSYSQNFIRVGAIIMLCHDICEIFSSA
ncbi:hypothetical protein PFNF54_00910 [Plasmodium falciparum NF54]|uniref:TLC domain-containing protein n=1 Tax=Plasmodium falciparum (isolate NF54) TaxID=5843 RepID=W7JYZ9_PLAFO|nr:hypothetical protein PFNF54_00910 [Plasmodium falciparum NF54]